MGEAGSEGPHGRNENARRERAWQSDETQTVESEHGKIAERSQCFVGKEIAGVKSKTFAGIQKRGSPCRRGPQRRRGDRDACRTLGWRRREQRRASRKQGKGASAGGHRGRSRGRRRNRFGAQLQATAQAAKGEDRFPRFRQGSERGRSVRHRRRSVGHGAAQEPRSGQRSDTPLADRGSSARPHESRRQDLARPSSSWCLTAQAGQLASRYRARARLSA
jgi:hypothetical protein